MINIADAVTQEQLEQARRLMRALIDWHRQSHPEDLGLINQYFDAKSFEEELSALPGKYAPPRGRLLLAGYNQQIAGCAALREIDDRSCEMKRMFVETQFQGKWIGRALADRLIQEARTIGYSSMLLETSIGQIQAQGLYRSLGFKRIEPYYKISESLGNWLVFMELPL